MKIFFSILLIILINRQIIAQPDSVFINMNNFLELKGVIAKKQGINNHKENFYFEELLTKDTTLNSKFGIYKFGTYLNEDCGYNILIKIENRFEFYDFYNFQFITKTLFNLNENHPDVFSEELLLKYLYKLSLLFEDDNRGKLDNKIIKKQYGNYYYFITLENYKP